MADGTKIEWTDATVNAINGCSVVSPGCTNCYAMRLAGTRLRNHASRAGLTVDSKAGPVWNGEVRLNEQALFQPLRWKKARRIFWNAHGDIFHPSVPDEWIDRCFEVMESTRHHIHQVLTKRADRMAAYIKARWALPKSINAFYGFDDSVQCYEHLPHIWLGVSVEDQARAHERIPALIDAPVAKRWLSCEPLLGPLDLGQLQSGLRANAWLTWLDALDWVVVGGESGRGARPMQLAWAREVRDQCAATGVPFFFKQWGAYVPCGQMVADGSLWTNGSNSSLLTTKGFAGRYLDGVHHDGMPA